MIASDLRSVLVVRLKEITFLHFKPLIAASAYVALTHQDSWIDKSFNALQVCINCIKFSWLCLCLCA